MRASARAKRHQSLVVDVGNSVISVGLYSGGRIIARDAVSRREGEKAVRKCIAGLVKGQPVAGCAVASVVPSANRGLEQMLRREWGLRPLWISAKIPVGIPVSYPHPERLGADRIANAVAAEELVRSPVIVADFGTALTFDVVLPGRGYCGGVIVPGPLMFLESLAEGTAMLPRLEPGGVSGRWGRSTEQAMLLGWKWGYTGMVDAITEKLSEAIGPGVKLVATGGMAKRVVRLLRSRYRVIPDLTLRGIGLILDFNVGLGADESD